MLSVSLFNCSSSLAFPIATISTLSPNPAMENNAGNSVRGPPEDYPSALAKAKVHAVEKSKQRTRQRQAESQRSSIEWKGRARPGVTSSLGQGHGTSIMLPSLQDQMGGAVVKQEHEIDLLSPKDIPKSSRLVEASKPNQYTRLVSAKKRKQEEQSPDPVHATVEHTAEQRPALLNRPFAPRKKPVRGARPLYDSVRLVDTRTTRHSSEWYERIDMKQKFARSDLESLKYLKSLIRNCEGRNGEEDTSKDGHSELQATFLKLRRRLHQMEFYDFLSGVLVKKSKLLEDEGLPSIFNRRNGVQYPWDIRADSLSLYQRWLAGVIDPHLLRGIETKSYKAANGKETKSRCLQKDYENRVFCNYIGAGGLQNGQWWPLQICAMRDGAHGMNPSVA